MATEDNEYFSYILNTLNKYQECHSQTFSSKKLRKAVRRVMGEEEEEMERNINNISDSKEGVDDIINSKERFEDISDFKEGVDDRNDSAKQVVVTNDSEKLVVDGSDPKSNPSVATHATNGISATYTTNGISTRKLYPLFIKPAIQATVRPIETRSRASCDCLDGWLDE